MICNVCDNPLVMCICDDIDARITELSKSPHISVNWDALRAQRFLNKFAIERLKAEKAKNNEPKTDRGTN